MIPPRHSRWAANVTVATLKKIERAIPAIEAAQAEQHGDEQQLLEWARAERDRIRLRRLAIILRVDPANLAKALLAKQRTSRTMLIRIEKLYNTGS